MRLNYNFAIEEISLNNNSVSPSHTRRVNNGPLEVEATMNSNTLFSLKGISVHGDVELELTELKELLTNDTLNVNTLLAFLKNDLADTIQKNGEVIGKLRTQALDRTRSARIMDAQADIDIEKMRRLHDASKSAE